MTTSEEQLHKSKILLLEEHGFLCIDNFANDKYFYKYCTINTSKAYVVIYVEEEGKYRQKFISITKKFDDDTKKTIPKIFISNFLEDVTEDFIKYFIEPSVECFKRIESVFFNIPASRNYSTRVTFFEKRRKDSDGYSHIDYFITSPNKKRECILISDQKLTCHSGVDYILLMQRMSITYPEDEFFIKESTNINASIALSLKKMERKKIASAIANNGSKRT